ncbi:MAG: hypothetical protein SWO11_00830 [Thermodesulfobacteriota bacterium]|nr:hypothetical protein [Thermodesulfobacteriota bacterium]
MDSCTLIPLICLFRDNKSAKNISLAGPSEALASNVFHQPQHHAGILCLTNKDTFPILLLSKRKFLSTKINLFSAKGVKADSCSSRARLHLFADLQASMHLATLLTNRKLGTLQVDLVPFMDNSPKPWTARGKPHPAGRIPI